MNGTVLIGLISFLLASIFPEEQKSNGIFLASITSGLPISPPDAWADSISTLGGVLTGFYGWRYSERSSFFWRERKRCSDCGPLFLYVVAPAFKKASQTCATLRPSRAAIVSMVFFRSE